MTAAELLFAHRLKLDALERDLQQVLNRLISQEKLTERLSAETEAIHKQLDYICRLSNKYGDSVVE